MKLKKTDEIIITKGKDKGKKGKIERIFPKLDMVLVPNINQFKRHVKAKTPGQKSEVVTITKPLKAANVSLICPKCNKPTRVGYKMEKGHKEKIRICRKCGKAI